MDNRNLQLNGECKQDVRAALTDLWDLLIGLYGYRFERQCGEKVDDSGGWWATLRDLTPDQFQNGLQAVKASTNEWPPTPIEFRNMCLTPKGLLKGDEALQEFMSYLREPPHRRSVGKLSPEVYHTYREYLDPVRIKQDKEMVVRQKFEAAYKRTLHHVLMGGELAEPPVQIEHKKTDPIPAPKGVAKSYLDKMKAELGL